MPPPDISVIITTYNRPAELARTLYALSKQDYPKDRFEVIVADDGSQERLDPVVQRFEGDLQIRLVRQKNAGPAAGRNLGAACARGELFAFTDDDCRPDPSWLTALKRAFDSHPECLFGGQTLAGRAQPRYSVASQFIQNIVYDFYNHDPYNARFFASNNMAMPASGFRSIDGFDPGFKVAAEDRDLCERWRHAGRRLIYVQDAVVDHFHSLNLAGFIRQHFGYGRGAARFHYMRVRRASSRWKDHTAFHRNWREWLFRPFRELAGFRAAHLMILLLIWQAANLAGFAYGTLLESGSRR